ncbi:MAG: GNAT family N-acetyltransferase [Saprospirales bacterium]|nr:GNAT family N-acetyltransferase [Saprospirales bacterium]
MIRHLSNTSIDRARYDACIAQAANGMPYAFSWYLDQIAGKWDVLVSGDYEAVCPLPWNAKWLGLKQVYQPLFCQQLGVFSKNLPGPELVRSFLEAIPPTFRRVLICLNEKNAVAEMPGWEIRPRSNFLLDLHRPWEVIEAGYSKSLKKRLRKAREEHKLVEAPLSPEDLSRLYQSQLGEKVECPPRMYRRFEGVMREAIARDLGRIWGATDLRGELLAAGFFLQSHGRIINMFGASTAMGKDFHSMHFLLDALIRRHAGQSLLLDFEGSSIPSIAYFFGSFGAEEVHYKCVGRDGMPKILRKLKERF